MDIPAVELKQVSKVFGDVTAVDRVSLRVAAGRVVALLGPSGCGKTTTLRLINRLEEPTSGQLLVRGKDVREQRPEVLRRSIGYVIQEGGLFPHLTVAENVATVPKLLGWDRARVEQRVGEVLEMVGLPGERFGQRMPAELSGGQRQRVGVARALAASPDLLLMDEPFGALDPGTREALQDEFVRLQKRLGMAVVVVTHDLAEAGKLADEIVLMDHGHIAQQGSLRDLLLTPASERVRQFLGSHAQGLALEGLYLRQVLGGLPVENPPIPAPALFVSLSPDLRLREALIALADVGDSMPVLLNGDSERRYSAGALRQRILADLREAGGGSAAGQTSSGVQTEITAYRPDTAAGGAS
ncbi:MAG: ATP-binding cassette domain-containing protein [Gemmataceae bacterium]|nr:ATP-binding cassette domain-containing protein [Gemmataceae bacterium]